MLISNSKTDTKLKETRKKKVYNNKHNFFFKCPQYVGTTFIIEQYTKILNSYSPIQVCI